MRGASFNSVHSPLKPIYHRRDTSSSPSLQLLSIYKVRFRTLLKLTRLTGYSAMSICDDSVGGIALIVSIGERSEAREKSTSSRLMKLLLQLCNKECMYTLIVCGAVVSGGARRRIDLSLTCPMNLLINDSFQMLLRYKYDHLFVSITLKNLE